MKFWKILKKQIEQTLPDWRDQFLSYKNLKKHLKIMCPKDANTPPRLESDHVNHFRFLLELEIDKFNFFFVNKEEEYIIKWKELQDRVGRAIESDTMDSMSLGREIVDFHGEMVLLENYSALNYTGLVKILKKHDKRTGALLRLPFIQEVFNQPFYETDVLNKLVKECEVILCIIFTNDWPSCPSTLSISEDIEKDEGGSATTSLAEIENMENKFIKLTSSALQTLEEIRGRSSTIQGVEEMKQLETRESSAFSAV